MKTGSLSLNRLDLGFTARSLQSEQSLRTSLSPKNFQEMIQMQSAENLWRFMHSGNLEPTHELTERSIPLRNTFTFPGRPKTSISSLTARENKRLEQRLGPQTGGSISVTPVGLLSARPATSVPSDIDFKRVLEKLNRITSHGGSDSRKLILPEGKTVDLMLDANEWLYVRILSSGQPAPLHIILRRSKGKLVTYISKAIQEPMEGLSDASYKGDHMIVTDSGPRFKTKTVFLGIHAIEETIFAIRALFGQHKKNLKLPRPEEGEDQDWMALMPQPSIRLGDKRPTKNFLEENKRLSPPLIDLTARKSAFEAKRQAALKRFHLNLEQKRSKALGILNKRQAKAQERELQRKEAEEKQGKEKMIKIWLALTQFAGMTEALETGFLKKKKELANERLRNFLAIRIQRDFRRYLKGQKTSALALLRCAHSLKLCKRHTFHIQRMGTASKIISCLRMARQNANVVQRFQGTYKKRKDYTVVFLQSMWRTAIKLKQSRFEKLIAAWNRYLAGIIESLGKKQVASRKGKRTKETGLPVNKYVSILSSAIRNPVLWQHYIEKKRQFLTDVRLYFVNRKIGVKGPPPDFRYMPEDEELRALIEKTAANSEAAPLS